MPTKSSVLITGASTGIGATYADRFARRGHDLVLVARDRTRMEALADRLRRETGVQVDILRADLTNARDLAQVRSQGHIHSGRAAGGHADGDLGACRQRCEHVAGRHGS